MPKVWMRITRDKYELPLAIADSAEELAEICNVKRETVASMVSSYEKGKLKTSRYICVNVEEDEDAETN